MKRRGFFGVMAGAAVAGPGMVKAAAEQAVTGLGGLNVPTSGSALSGLVGGQYAMKQASSAIFDQPPDVMARELLAKVVGMTAAQRSRAKKRLYVQALDPDILGYRSIALHAKLDWQRERQLNAMITERKTMWQRMADGIFGDDPDEPPV